MKIPASPLLRFWREKPVTRTIVVVAIAISASLSCSLGVKVVVEHMNVHWALGVALSVSLFTSTGLAFLFAMVVELIHRDAQIRTAFYMRTGEDIDDRDARGAAYPFIVPPIPGAFQVGSGGLAGGSGAVAGGLSGVSSAQQQAQISAQAASAYNAWVKANRQAPPVKPV